MQASCTICTSASIISGAHVQGGAGGAGTPQLSIPPNGEIYISLVAMVSEVWGTTLSACTQAHGLKRRDLRVLCNAKSSAPRTSFTTDFTVIV